MIYLIYFISVCLMIFATAAFGHMVIIHFYDFLFIRMICYILHKMGAESESIFAHIYQPASNANA